MTTIEFSYRGFAFSYQTTRGRNEKEESELKAAFDLYHEELKIKPKERQGLEVSIDWDAFMKHFEKEGSKEERDVTSLLFALRIITVSPKNAWAIISDNMLLNPRYSSILFFFSEKLDAAAFAAARLMNTGYSWYVTHLTEIMSRDNIRESIACAETPA